MCTARAVTIIDAPAAHLAALMRHAQRRLS
jgi:hypothetical protein